MPASIYLADKIINHVLRTATFTKATNLYWALGSVDFTTNGLTASELANTGGYARAAIAVADADWLAPFTSGAYRITTNISAINFGTASANLNSSNPVGFISLWDSATIGAGNMWLYGVISTPRVILSGDPITIAAGAADFGLGI
jgi:hypothetical protein